MTLSQRIATRHIFETRILIGLNRNNQNLAVHGWVRDLSESGFGAFVAEHLAMGELISVTVQLSASGKEVIPAKVTRQLGTQYGFQFTALSAEQRESIRTKLKEQPAIPFADWK